LPGLRFDTYLQGDKKMKRTAIYLAFAAGMFTAAAGVPNASASPSGAMLNLGMPDLSVAEKVARRCWWHRGVRHCRYRGSGAYGYSPNLPEAYRTGSGRWWQEMDRQDRGGRGRP
jgi:hypothetical protein